MINGSLKTGNKKKVMFLLLGIVLAGVLLRLVLLFTAERGVDGDEACFGLMAKHILTKGEYPIFLWEAHYAGALISYIGAIIFYFFGVSSISLKSGTLFFVIFSIWFTYLLASRVRDEKIGLLSALLVAICPGFVATFSIRAYGGHTEVLMFGPLILLLLYSLIYKPKTSLYILLGFVCGLSFWITPAILPFLLVVGTFFLFKEKRILFSRKFYTFIFFFFIGVLPFIIYNIQKPFVSFFRLGGRVLALDRQILKGYANPLSCFLERIIFRLKCVPHSLSIMPKILLNLLALDNGSPLALRILGVFIYLAFTFYFFYFLLKKFIKKEGRELYINIFLTFGIWVILFFCLGGLGRTRHLLFIYPIVSIFLATFLFKLNRYSKMLSIFCAGIIFLNNLSSNITLIQEERVPLRPLISFLESKNIFYGYGAYHIAYPVVFESNEKIILSPAIGSGSDDRYPPYTQQVSNAKDICYILDSQSLDYIMFEGKMRELNIRYQKQGISNFLVYYGFSQKISPEDLNFPASAF